MKIKIISMFMAMLFICVAFLPSCNTPPEDNDSTDDTDVNNEFEADEPYKLYYDITNSSQGVCGVWIVTNPLYEEPFTVTIPEEGPDGLTVTILYSSLERSTMAKEFSNYPNLPRIITADAFEDILSKVNNQFGEESWESKRFEFSYTIYDPSSEKNETYKEYMIKTYPICETTPLAVLYPDFQNNDLENIVTILTDSGYTAKDHLEDVSELNNAIRKSNTDMTPIAYNFADNIVAIELPDSINRIYPEAFMNCINLRSVNIPEGVKSIEDSTFKNCRSLESVELPEGVTNIGREAFYGCEALKNVPLPDTLEFVGALAFLGCDNIEGTVYDGGKYLGTGENAHAVLISMADKTTDICSVHKDTRIIVGSFALFINEDDRSFPADSKLERLYFEETNGWTKASAFSQYKSGHGTAVTPEDLKNSSEANASVFAPNHRYNYESWIRS